MKLLGCDWATIRPEQEAALSEGFCPDCLVRLNDPILGSDGPVVVRATSCPKCKVLFVL